jgi:type IV secretion system protein VirB10
MNNRIEPITPANDQHARAPEPAALNLDDLTTDDNASTKALNPKPGEAGIPNVATRPSAPKSAKALLAVGLLICTIVALAAIWIQRLSANNKKPDDEVSKRAGDRPAAATTEPRKLDMPPLKLDKASSAAVIATGATNATAGAPGTRIPALLPTPEEAAEPIGVRRTGQGAPSPNGGNRTIPPEDTPVLVVSSKPGSMGAPNAAPLGRPSIKTAPTSPGTEASEALDPNDPLAATSRNLQGYQRQLQGLLDSMTQSAALAAAPSPEQPARNTPMGATTFGMPSSAGTPTGAPSGTTPFGMPPSAGTPTNAPTGGGAPTPTTTPTGALFGGQLQGSATPRVAASMLGNRSLTLPKGTAFTCALKTKLISATSGLVGCQVQRNVFSDDGRVLLIERGSHLDGEYRIASVRPGMVRIPVLWTRLRTPHGVTVEIESPGTGPLGESGVDGYVDNRWFERIGAAMLLSLIDDSVKLVIQSQANQNDSGGANTIVLPSTTSNASKLAEKVLDSTINIPPLIYQNQGGIVGIYVARDVDFSSVYELKPTTRNSPPPAAPTAPREVQP